jgi:hypothetical protein
MGQKGKAGKEKNIETEKSESLFLKPNPTPPHPTLSRFVAHCFCGHNITRTLRSLSYMLYAPALNSYNTKLKVQNWYDLLQEVAICFWNFIVIFFSFCRSLNRRKNGQRSPCHPYKKACVPHSIKQSEDH